MRILGIDFGLKKIGFSLATTDLAEPLNVIRFEDEKEVLIKIVSLVNQEKIEKIVVGLSEGDTAIKTRAFVNSLQPLVNIPIELTDETLSTQTAQDLAIEAGIGRDKRKRLEDAFAATVMLQSYLDRHV
jgi:putative Holliday junction resolvase